MMQPLQPPLRRTVLARANWHICMAGIVLAGGIPKDAEELKLLKEVLRLLRARGPEQSVKVQP